MGRVVPEMMLTMHAMSLIHGCRYKTAGYVVSYMTLPRSEIFEVTKNWTVLRLSHAVPSCKDRTSLQLEDLPCTQFRCQSLLLILVR